MTELTKSRVGSTAWLEVKDRAARELGEPITLSDGELGRGEVLTDAQAQGGWLVQVTVEADVSSFGRERYQVVGPGRRGRERRIVAERYRLTFDGEPISEYDKEKEEPVAWS